MATLKLEGQQLKISGHVNYRNAAQIDQEGRWLITQHSNWPLQINLSEVEQGNTLLLAMIIQWLRYCPKMDSLSLIKVPTKMLGIIQASHLEHLISH